MRPRCAACGGKFTQQEWEARHSSGESGEEDIHAQCCGLEACKTTHQATAKKEGLGDAWAKATKGLWQELQGGVRTSTSVSGSSITYTTPTPPSYFFRASPARKIEPPPPWQEVNPCSEQVVVKGSSSPRVVFTGDSGFVAGEQRSTIVPGYVEYKAVPSDRISAACSSGLHGRCSGDRWYDTSDGLMRCQCPHHQEVRIEDESNYT